MNYKIEEIEDQYCIIENRSESIIRKYSDKNKAKKFLRHLNLGGGFDGWTPNFFVKSLELSVQND